MRRAAIHTAASVKAANTTVLIRTMTIEAESNAGGEINACQAYAKRAPAASARICLFHESDRRADAPDNVQAEHVHRPWDGDAKRRYEAGAQQVLMRIIRIEERLSCQSLLHDAVGRGEYRRGDPPHDIRLGQVDRRCTMAGQPPPLIKTAPPPYSE
jgi:hypothetical protein